MMRAIRAAFTLVLVLVGFVPFRDSIGHPRATPIHSEEELADRLRRQGKDPRQYLIWNGSPLMLVHHNPIVPRDSNFDIVALVQAFEIPSSLCVERYLLLDEAGFVRDLATLTWPSRWHFEVESVRFFGESSEPYLEILDPRLKRGPDIQGVPYIELGVESGPSKRVFLPWTGSPRLGKLWIEGRHFRIEGASN